MENGGKICPEKSRFLDSCSHRKHLRGFCVGFHEKCGVFEACKKVADYFDTLKTGVVSLRFFFLGFVNYLVGFLLMAVIAQGLSGYELFM